MGIWNIMKTVLDALEDAKATVAEILGHNEDAIQGFGSFMNALLIIEQHPSDFATEWEFLCYMYIKYIITMEIEWR